MADTLIFIICLEADSCPKRAIMPGDMEMLRERLKVFPFTKPIESPDTKLSPCGVCWAQFVLERGAGSMEICSLPPMSSDIRSWSVEDVVALVTKLQVPHEIFRLHAVDGVVLQTLSEEELQAELGLTLLQARKVASHRPQTPAPP